MLLLWTHEMDLHGLRSELNSMSYRDTIYISSLVPRKVAALAESWKMFDSTNTIDKRKPSCIVILNSITSESYLDESLASMA